MSEQPLLNQENVDWEKVTRVVNAWGRTVIKMFSEDKGIKYPIGYPVSLLEYPLIVTSYAIELFIAKAKSEGRLSEADDLYRSSFFLEMLSLDEVAAAANDKFFSEKANLESVFQPIKQ